MALLIQTKRNTPSWYQPNIEPHSWCPIKFYGLMFTWSREWSSLMSVGIPQALCFCVKALTSSDALMTTKSKRKIFFQGFKTKSYILNKSQVDQNTWTIILKSCLISFRFISFTVLQRIGYSDVVSLVHNSEIYW